ncbi:MAG: phosphoribosylglycinamide formyltransferase [Bacteroidales bacterium]
MMKRIALFASGNGTNVQRICEYFKDSPEIQPVLILSDNAKAFVLKRAENLGVPALWISRNQLQDASFIMPILAKYAIDFIVLAGFLRLVPAYLIEAYPDKILNIHPALLPKYGGKGMYGSHVHEAVVKAKETESGISIHYVSAKYDEGDIVFQAKCSIEPNDTAEDVAKKIHVLEYTYFPQEIEKCILEIK